MAHSLHKKIKLSRATVLLALCMATLFFAPFSISSPSSISELTTVLQPTYVHANGNFWETVANPLDALVDFMGLALMNSVGLLVWVAGLLLEITFKFTVLEMGIHLGSDGLVGIAIENAWSIIRDICNLAFIFGFIYLGIRTIFDPDSARVKSMLANIIIGALLINFSLFFTRMIVDFSNYASVEIYKSISTVEGSSLSAKLFDTLGLVTLYNMNGPNEFWEAIDDVGFAFYLMASVFLLATAVVFLSASMLVISRFVMLIFLMIASPILFAGTIFPQTQGHADDMWKKLINYSIFAPAYLLLILLSLTVIDALGVSLQGTGVAEEILGSATGGTGSIDTIMHFSIAIFFMISSLTIAQKCGIYGAETAIKMRKGAQGLLGRGVSYAALWAPRKVARYGVSKASKIVLGKFDTMQATEDNKLGGFGRGLKKVVQWGDFDQTIRSGLESGKKAKFGLIHSRDEETKIDEERNKRISETTVKIERKKARETYTTAATNNTLTPAIVEDLAKAIKNSTADEIKDMDFEVISQDHIAYNLTIKQIEKLQESGKYSDADIEKIKEAKNKYAKAIADGTVSGTANRNGESYAAVLARRGSEELAKMPIEVFTESTMAEHLTPAMVEAKMKDGTISPNEVGRIRANIDSYIRTQRNNNNPNLAYEKQWKVFKKTGYGARLGLTTV